MRISWKTDDPLVAVERAKQQGAFISWNHPGLDEDGNNARSAPQKTDRRTKDRRHRGDEQPRFYPAALKWCALYHKTRLACTDIHGRISETYGNRNFQDRSRWSSPKTKVASILRSGCRKNLALFDGLLAGAEECLRKIVVASMRIHPSNSWWFEISNLSDIPFEMLYGETHYVIRMEDDTERSDRRQ